MEGYRYILKFYLILAVITGAVFSIPEKVFSAGEAILRLSPASGSFLVGSTFDLSVILDTKGVGVNTVEVELMFPPDKIQVASPSVGKSIIQVWPAPPVFSNREGKIYFVGGIPSPGIVTSDGVVLTLTFRVVSPGDAQISFGDKTSVLANDGRGTDILGQKPSSFYRFSVPAPQGPEISSPTHPDQERWYRDPNPVFIWPRSTFADGYSYAIDHDPSGFPDTSFEGSSPTASYENLENGIWYLHLRERAGDVWGGVSHYVVKIDNEQPASFKINVSPSRRTNNRNPIFRFFTTDSLSGFDHFEMKIIPLSQGEITEALFFEISSPYQSPTLNPGRYQVIVRALDRAGNTRDEALTLHILGLTNRFFTPEGIDLIWIFLPWFWILVVVLGLFALLLLLFISLWVYHKRHLEFSLREDLKKILHFFRKGGPPTAIIVLILAGYYFFSADLPEKPSFAASHRNEIKLTYEFAGIAGFSENSIREWLAPGESSLVEEPADSKNLAPRGAKAELIMDAGVFRIGDWFYFDFSAFFRRVKAFFWTILAAIKDAFINFFLSVRGLNYAIAESNKPLQILAPSISVAPSEYYPLDEAIYLEGRTDSKSRIQLYFEKISGGVQPVSFMVEANSNGEWFLSERLELSSGEWSVRARVLSDPPSDWSNPRIIKSVVSGFIIGGFKIKYAPMIVLLLILFLSAGGLFIYSIFRVRTFERKAAEGKMREKTMRLEKELREKEREIVEHAVSDNFSEIRKKFAEEVEHIEAKLRISGKLTSEEEEHREKLLRELREAEEEIEKKIKNIA